MTNLHGTCRQEMTTSRDMKTLRILHEGGLTRN
jgi:hypothetical protein